MPLGRGSRHMVLGGDGARTPGVGVPARRGGAYAPRRSHVMQALPPSGVTWGAIAGAGSVAAPHAGRRSVGAAPGRFLRPGPAPAAPAAAMGASGSKSRGLWPFASPAAGGGGAEGSGGQQALARARAARAATPFVFTRRG